jgi:hypothetical protein
MTAGQRPASAARAPRWLVFAGIAIVLVFMAAMVAQYAQTRSARAEAATLRQELAVARGEAMLAAAAIEAQRGSFESARRLASDFFTDLQATEATAPATVQPTVRTILEQRDPTITLLSRSDPQSAAVLVRMFTQYRAALHGPGR